MAANGHFDHPPDIYSHSNAAMGVKCNKKKTFWKERSSKDKSKNWMKHLKADKLLPDGTVQQQGEASFRCHEK